MINFSRNAAAGNEHPLSKWLACNGLEEEDDYEPARDWCSRRSSDDTTAVVE